MSPWKVVFLKEVRENMRDKRTMFSTFVLGTLMGPVLFAGLIALMISIMLERGEKPLELPIVGAGHAHISRHICRFRKGADERRWDTGANDRYRGGVLSKNHYWADKKRNQDEHPNPALAKTHSWCSLR